jgi:hypothetical protein
MGELDPLRQTVAGTWSQLEKLESVSAEDHSAIESLRSHLFQGLKESYLHRDRVRLLVEFRSRYLEALLSGDQKAAVQAGRDLEQARIQIELDYEQAAAAVSQESRLTIEEEFELARLWKALVKRYHPDRIAQTPIDMESCEKLTRTINRAKEEKDLETLSRISKDPDGYLLRRGWPSLELDEDDERRRLRWLLEELQPQIVTAIDAQAALRETPDYELCRLMEKRPGLLEELIAERKRQLEEDIRGLEAQAHRIAGEIREISGEPSPF